jgi:hypothetical protein
VGGGVDSGGLGGVVPREGEGRHEVVAAGAGCKLRREEVRHVEAGDSQAGGKCAGDGAGGGDEEDGAGFEFRAGDAGDVEGGGGGEVLKRFL